MQTNVNKSIYYKFGYDTFGPLLLGFTKWLSMQVAKTNVDTMLFLSRDGYMMHRAFECLNGKELEIKDFYCSRKSLRTALLWKYDSYDQMLQLLNKVKVVSVADMLGFWGFTDSQSELIAKKNEIELDYVIPFDELKHNNLFKKMYADNIEVIRKESKLQNDFLLEYISNSITGSRCGIVDIGWHGSMQFYLEKFVDINGLKIEFLGFYVGIAAFYDLRGETYGFLFQSEDDELRRKVLCSHGVLEKLFQSKEGSTIGYKKENGEITPIKNNFEYKNDALVQNCIDEWQNGAISYINDTRKNDITIDDCKKMARKYIAFGMHPKLKDIEVFKFLYNLEVNQYYYVATKPFYRYGTKELWVALNASPWKTGFLKSLIKIPLPYYWFYRMVSK